MICKYVGPSSRRNDKYPSVSLRHFVEIEIYHTVLRQCCKPHTEENELVTTCNISCLNLFILEPLLENSEWQKDLRFVQATITNFSLYAVICRLKSYKFSFDASMKGRKLTCQVPSPISECSDVRVTIPRKSLSKEVELTMKVSKHYWELLYGCASQGLGTTEFTNLTS